MADAGSDDEQAQVAGLARRLGHSFTTPDLLREALSHRSWCAEEGEGCPSNERLEFLGDSVLGVVVTLRLFAAYPDLDEGKLSRFRLGLINASRLAEVARSLDVGSALRLGKGERLSGGRDKTSILSDAMEAIIGAVYLDAGMDAASDRIGAWFASSVASARLGIDGDPKSRLQEHSVRHLDREPVYRVDVQGPDHQRVYLAYVQLRARQEGSQANTGRVGDDAGGDAADAAIEYGPGEGRSKKEAEQMAAEIALEQVCAESVQGDSKGVGIAW